MLRDMNNRIDKIQSFLKHHSLDGFLVTKPENILWLTGFQGSFGFVVVLQSGTLFLITDSRYAQKAQSLASERDFEFVLFDVDFSSHHGNRFSGLFALENSLTCVRKEQCEQWFPSVSFSIYSETIERFRRHKSDDELGFIEQSQNHLDCVLVPFLKANLKTGITERALAFQLEIVLRDQGRFGLAFDSIVAFGPHSAVPHHVPTDRALRSGDTILIDCGVSLNEYRCDMTRNFAWQSVSDEYKDRYTFLLEIQKQLVQEYVPGTQTQKLQHKTKQLLGDEAKYYTHSLGHGIGLETHEIPSFYQKSEDVLQEHDVVTCEPGLYYPGKFGIRIEDLIHITSKGPVILSQTTRDLIVF
jgi:Xaa-Pro aminopeptidase